VLSAKVELLSMQKIYLPDTGAAKDRLRLTNNTVDRIGRKLYSPIFNLWC